MIPSTFSLEGNLADIMCEIWDTPAYVPHLAEITRISRAIAAVTPTIAIVDVTDMGISTLVSKTTTSASTALTITIVRGYCS